MPSLVLSQIERRLTELACPPAELRRRIRELAEHHDDLKRDALEEGLSETDAEARADERLGEPAVLAEHLAAALRQSSWWGRHPIIGFCLLPPLAIIPLFLLGMWLEYWIGRLYFTKDQLGSLSDWETGLKYCRLIVWITYYAAIISAAFLFCALARRTVRGFKWAGAACVICALHGAFFFATITPHNFTLGFTNHLHWAGALLPVCVALLIWLKLRRSANRFAPLPARGERKNFTPLPSLPKTGLITPTSLITMLIVAAISILIYRAHIPVKHVTTNQSPDSHTAPVKSPAPR